jgi:uncharacterized protein (TIGR02246 family)
MKYLMILTAGICSLLFSLSAMADQAEDEAAIRKVVAAIEAAYNAHDPSALLPLLDDTVVILGRTMRDKREAETFWSEAFAQSKNAKRQFLEEIDIVFVTPDVAIYKSRYERTGRADANGKALPPNQAIAARVLVKRDDTWLLAASFGQVIVE